MWTAGDWAILIGAVGLLLGQVAGFIAAMVGLARQKEAKIERHEMSAKQDKIENKQEAIHALVNSQSEKLNTAVATIARAEGKAAGIEEERVKPMIPAPPVVVNIPEQPSPLPVLVVDEEGTPVPIKPETEEKK